MVASAAINEREDEARDKAITAALKFAKKMRDNGFTEYEAHLTAVKLKGIVEDVRSESIFTNKFAENYSLK